MKMTWRVASAIVLLIASSASRFHEDPVRIKVFLVPLDDGASAHLGAVTEGIKSVYGVQVEASKVRALPSSAFYKPRSRYRADRLLPFLSDERQSGFDKVIGVTTKDISATVGKHEDWGVIGYAGIGGTSCVVSAFRLGGAGKLRTSRLKNAAVHELGHTFGLEHCEASKVCVMQDYQRGGKKVLDREGLALCKSCRTELEGLGRAPRG